VGVNAKAKGATKERASKALYEKDGWHVTKAGGSLGAADLVALKAGERPQLIQVKATAKGPFHSFGPRERGELLEVAKAAGAVPVLAWWKPYARAHKLIESWDWP
jgi:Holliday junction resolvase